MAKKTSGGSKSNSLLCKCPDLNHGYKKTTTATINLYTSASKDDYSLGKLSIVNYHLPKELVHYIHIYLTSNPSSDSIYTLDSKMKLQKFRIGSTLC